MTEGLLAPMSKGEPTVQLGARPSGTLSVTWTPVSGVRTSSGSRDSESTVEIRYMTLDFAQTLEIIILITILNLMKTISF